ncbi:MAG: 30S ribosomal protein S2 [Planctomycetota bacterium]|nr:30S ribosomal protein S2 [Planctomycetota bacterium]
MAIVDVKEIIQAGVHFGHRVSRWHPKMEPFIFGKRNLIHIIDVRETLKGLVRACNFLTQVSAQGGQVVFVGTKRQAKSIVQRDAERSENYYVAERWLGGSLTNLHTIRKRLKRLVELETLEETGEIERHSKKQVSRLRRERRKIFTNLNGLRKMEKIPAALIAVDIRREHIAIREARKCGIPVIALVDTDCDPGLVDIVIPGNDDAFRSIEIILGALADALLAGKEKYAMVQAEEEKKRMEEAESRKKEQEKVDAVRQEGLDAKKERDEIFRKAREGEAARVEAEKKAANVEAPPEAAAAGEPAAAPAAEQPAAEEKPAEPEA